MEERRPLVAVIHATWAASPPIVEAFAAEYPQARLWQLLDDRLIADAVDIGSITPELLERLRRLVRHAVAGQADAILLTCSMYAGYADWAGAAEGIRMLPSDGALHRAVIASRAKRAVVLFSLDSAVQDGRDRLRAAVRASGVAMEIKGVVAPRALAASGSGDWQGVVQALASVAAPYVTRDTIVALGQYSLAPAAAALSQRLGIEVLSGPQLAAREMRAILEGDPQVTK
jgi:hypothetical protein